MANLEEIVRERNRAYMLLETGDTGERPRDYVIDSFGKSVCSLQTYFIYSHRLTFKSCG